MSNDNDKIDDPVLDWALGERLGGQTPPDLLDGVRAQLANGPAPATRPASLRPALLAAAAVLFGTFVVIAVSLSNRDAPQDNVTATSQDPGEPVRVHSRADIEALPADCRHVIGIGIEDEAMPALLRLRNLVILELQARLPLPGATSPSAPVETITDEGLALLTSLQGLRALHLRYQDKVTGAGLAHLQQLRRLETLTLLQMTADEPALSAIAAITSLRVLELRFCRGWSEQGVAHVLGMARLRGLYLASNLALDPDWLGGLDNLTQLESLDLGYIGMKDFATVSPPMPMAMSARHLAPLQGLTSLSDLSLAGSNVDAAGLLTLRALPITRLDLTDRRGIGTLDIKALATFPSLEELVVGRSDLVGEPSPLAEARRLPHLKRIVVAGTVVDLQDPDEPARVSSRGEVDALPASTKHVIATGLEDDDLPALLRLRQLEILELRAIWPSPISPDKPLRPLGTLTDAGLLRLAGMKKLRSLLLISQMELQGPGLEVLTHLPALTELQLELVTADDDAFAVLAKLPRLEVLHLRHCTGIGEATLERIAQLVTLRDLSLASCSHLDERWIAKVARLPRLERLDLGQIGSRTMFSGISPVEIPEPGTGVTDVVCEALAEARKLRYLNLAYGDISALGIASLQDLPLLTLDLTGVDVTKRHLVYLPATLTSLVLAGNPNDRDLSLLGMILAEETPALTSLNFQSSSVTDAGVASLHHMPALTSLNLGWCQGLTADVVPELRKLEQLGSLDLRGLKWVTEAHLEQLRAMPHLSNLSAEVATKK